MMNLPGEKVNRRLSALYWTGRRLRQHAGTVESKALGAAARRSAEP
jgi:hypothetical protein